MPENTVSDGVQSKDPRTGMSIGEFTPTKPSDLSAIVADARTAGKLWAAKSLHERHRLVRSAYEIFYDRREEIASLISDETGKPLHEAYSMELLPVLDCFKYYLKHTRHFLRPTAIQPVNPLLMLRKGFVRWEPCGVVGVISPWNFPLLLSMQHIVPALLAGNAVVHKPSEYTTLVGLKIARLFENANLDTNVFTVVTGFADVGQALVGCDLDKIFFTGSTNVGKKIYQVAAQNLTPVNMELGGSDPMVVLDDADLDRTTNAAVWGAFGNAGQACVSVERLFVQESIYDAFLNGLVEKSTRLRVGHAAEQHDVSCVVNETQFRKVDALLRDAKDKGVVIRLGGKSRNDLGELYYEPTIVSDTNAAMNINQQEIFGPVVMVSSFSSDAEAIELANDTEFGLSASVWSENEKRAMSIAQQIDAGSVLINELQVQLAQFEAPYAGYKQSGLGVSHGSWGMLEMVRPKYISVDRPLLKRLFGLLFPNLKSKNLWWFPYDEGRLHDYRAFLQFLNDPSFMRRLAAIPGALKALMRKDLQQ